MNLSDIRFKSYIHGLPTAASTKVPIASFLIPVYNGEAFLAEALESALAQTETNIEVVVIDDGSQDGTRAILRNFAGRDSRVRVFEEEHRGLIAALNRGLEVARGKYICRLDADDITTPDRVEKQVAFLEEHSDYVLVGGQVKVVTGTGETIGSKHHPLSAREIAIAMKRTCCIEHSAATFRRVEAICLGGYDPLFVLAEDYELWVRFIENFKVANLPDVVCHYRIHGNQVTPSGILRQMFMWKCIQAVFRGASRELIRECIQAPAEEFFTVLCRLGYSKEEISDHLTGGYLHWVRALKANGRLQQASQLLSDAIRHLLELRCRTQYLAEAYSMGVLLSLQAHNYLWAVRYLLLALASSPVDTISRVWNKIAAPVFGHRRNMPAVP